MKHSKCGISAIVLAVAISGEALADDRNSWGLYFGATGSPDFTEVETDTLTLNNVTGPSRLEIASAGSFGYTIGANWERLVQDNLALGIELAYRKNEFDVGGRLAATLNANTNDTGLIGSGELTSTALMATTKVFTGTANSKNRWFLSGGLGAASIEEKGTARVVGPIFDVIIDDVGEVDVSDTRFAWQLGFGFDRRIGEKNRVRLAYTFFNAGDGEFVDAETHGLTFGILF